MMKTPNINTTTASTTTITTTITIIIDRINIITNSSTKCPCIMFKSTASSECP